MSDPKADKKQTATKFPATVLNTRSQRKKTVYKDQTK